MCTFQIWHKIHAMLLFNGFGPNMTGALICICIYLLWKFGDKWNKSSTRYKTWACLKNTWSRDLREFQKMSSFVLADIDWGHIMERTGADSPPSSSHAMHQNNWQHPIIPWSVYRRSDGPPGNKSAIRKPAVWITDVMPAGHRVDEIGQWQPSKKRRQLFP